MTITQAREVRVAFADPYMRSGLAPLRKGGGLADAPDGWLVGGSRNTRIVRSIGNACRVQLLDHPRLRMQVLGLERRASRGGRDTVDHAPNAHDDVANAVCGALVLAASGSVEPQALNLRERPWTRRIGRRWTLTHRGRRGSARTTMAGPNALAPADGLAAGDGPSLILC